MEARNERGNSDEGSTTTNGNARPNTRRNQGQQANANPNAKANVGAGNPPVDAEMVCQLLVNLLQAGVVGNVGGANPVASIRNNYAELSREYTSLDGKPFVGTEDPVEVENWLLSCERICTDLGLDDGQKRRLDSRQLQGAALFSFISPLYPHTNFLHLHCCRTVKRFNCMARYFILNKFTSF